MQTSKRALVQTILALALAAPVGAQLPAPPATWQQQPTVAFVNVNVVPMDRERVIQDQTVVVQNGRITAMGPAASTSVPSGAIRVDARGKYLMPGLSEMHGHFPWQTGPFQEDVMFLYVAAGATTVRGMQGNPSHIPMRERVRKGEIIGPHLYLSTPPLGGNITNPDSARALVRRGKEAGYDHLKVHEGLTPEVYRAIDETADELGIPYGGHISDIVGLDAALAARQSTIDHLDNYIDAAQRAGSPALALQGGERQQALPLHVDNARIPVLARATREANVANVPTMALWDVLRGSHTGDELVSRPENIYMPRAMVEQWRNQVNQISAGWSPEAAAAEKAFRRRMLKGLHDAGAVILMGTDAPQLFSVPGFSLHRELAVAEEAGLTPYETLRTGTVAVAEYYDELDEAGTIAVGKRADLVLVDRNPLEAIANIAYVSGVMVNGRWLSGEERQRRLDELAARNRTAQ